MKECGLVVLVAVVVAVALEGFSSSKWPLGEITAGPGTVVLASVGVIFAAEMLPDKHRHNGRTAHNNRLTTFPGDIF